MEENKLLIQITHGFNGKKSDPFLNEKDAIIFLKDILVKRLNKINENILSFDLENGIGIKVKFHNEYETLILKNELEAIEYLKSLYKKRLDIEFTYCC